MNSALIIEDMVETGKWLESVLFSAFPLRDLTICRNMRDALAFLDRQQPDLVLVDINLPDGSGLDLIPAIFNCNTKAYVVVTSILDDQDHILSALQAGAQGYLLKDLSKPVFIQKLRGILQGEPPLSPKIARKILQYFSQSPSSSICHASEPLSKAECELSAREQEVLLLLGKGLSRREVAQALDLSDNTIATHIRNVYRKLNISSRAEAALEASRLGLIRQGS